MYLNKYKYFAPYITSETNINKKILDYSQKISFSPKEIIKFQGDFEHDLFFLSHGVMLITCTLDDGTQSIQHFGGPGCYFGIASILSNKSYLTSAIAYKTCLGYILKEKTVLNLIQKDISFIKDCFFLENERSIINMYRIRLLSIRSVKQRILLLLLGFCAKIGTYSNNYSTIPLKLTHQIISEIINCDRVTVSRIVGLLKKNGILSKKNGYITVNISAAIASLDADI